MTPPNVAVLVGSLRKESLSRKVALAIAEIAEGRLALSLVELGALPMYNPDLEDRALPPWVDLRERIKAADAVLFVTPEYNRSVPAVLKNAIDIGSRPSGQSVWAGKPAAVVSVSPGTLGAFGAHHHLRQSLVFLDMPTLQQPELYLGGAESFFDSAGELKDARVRALFERLVSAFREWIERTRRR